MERISSYFSKADDSLPQHHSDAHAPPPELEGERSTAWLPSVASMSTFLPAALPTIPAISSMPSMPSLPSMPSFGANESSTRPSLRRSLSTYLFSAANQNQQLPTTLASTGTSGSGSGSSAGGTAQSMSDTPLNVTQVVGGLRRSVSSLALSGRDTALRLAGYKPPKEDIVMEEVMDGGFSPVHQVSPQSQQNPYQQHYDHQQHQSQYDPQQQQQYQQYDQQRQLNQPQQGHFSTPATPQFNSYTQPAYNNNNNNNVPQTVSIQPPQQGYIASPNRYQPPTYPHSAPVSTLPSPAIAPLSSPHPIYASNPTSYNSSPKFDHLPHPARTSLDQQQQYTPTRTPPILARPPLRHSTNTPPQQQQFQPQRNYSAPQQPYVHRLSSDAQRSPSTTFTAPPTPTQQFVVQQYTNQPLVHSQRASMEQRYSTDGQRVSSDGRYSMDQQQQQQRYSNEYVPQQQHRYSNEYVAPQPQVVQRPQAVAVPSQQGKGYDSGVAAAPQLF